MDRLNAMAAFLRVAELGSFSAAARELGLQQSTVSKWMAALEAELGVRLIDRSTRVQRLTQEGESFLVSARAMTASWESARAGLGGGSLRGTLRVSLPVVFGQRHIVPLVPAFARAHPDLKLVLRFSDRYVNLMEAGVDVAVRVGALSNSSFRNRTLARSSRVLVAAPSYLRDHGTPKTPQALTRHRCLLHPHVSQTHWQLRLGRRSLRVPVAGPLVADNSDALRQFAVDGLGIALLARWLVHDDLASGALAVVLSDAELLPAPVRAVLPAGTTTPKRVEAWLTHLKDGLVGLA